MADVSAQPIPEFGNLISQYGQNQANIGLANAQTNLMGAQAPLVQAQTGQAQAQTGLLSQQAQKAQLEVAMMRKAMADAESAQQNPDNSQDDQSGIDPTGAGVASYLNAKYTPNLKGPANLQPYLNNPTMAMAFPQVVQRADEMRKINVEQQQTQIKQDANDVYATATALAGGKDQTLATLLNSPSPTLRNIGRAINSRTDMTQEEKDAAAKNAIDSAAKTAFRFTGQKTAVRGNQEFSEETGQPVYGTPNINPSPDAALKNIEESKNPKKAIQGSTEATVYTTPSVDAGGKIVPPGGAQAPAGGPAKRPGQQTSGINALPPGPQKAQAITQSLVQAGAPPDKAAFVGQLPDGLTPRPGNQVYSADDELQRKPQIDAQNLTLQKANQSTLESNSILTNVSRLNTLLSTPGLKFGPASKEYYQMKTMLGELTSTPAGQAAAWQVVNKILNENQLTTAIKELKGPTADVQLRLGAYETRTIMENMAANTTMTLPAIQQMLKYQASDSKYELDKANTAKMAVHANRDVRDFDANYGAAFPKQTSVDTGMDVLTGKKTSIDYSKYKGTTGSQKDLEAAAAHYGIPAPIFLHNVTSAGGIVK